MAEISGLKVVLARMKGVTIEMVERVADAVDVTAIDMANHAKAGHQKGAGHGLGRYENLTTNLTNSIMPVQTHVGDDFIESVVGPTDNVKLTATLAAIMKYGPKVEARYPFMRPAKAAFREKFKKRVKEAVGAR